MQTWARHAAEKLHLASRLDREGGESTGCGESGIKIASVINQADAAIEAVVGGGSCKVAYILQGLYIDRADFSAGAHRKIGALLRAAVQYAHVAGREVATAGTHSTQTDPGRILRRAVRRESEESAGRGEFRRQIVIGNEIRSYANWSGRGATGL